MSSFVVALKRLREDRAPALGLGLLVFVTATVFGLAPRVLERVGDDALRGVVTNAGALSRNIGLVDDGFIQPGPPGNPLLHFGEEGDTLEARMPASIRQLIGDRSIVTESSRWRIQAPTPDPAFARFRIQPGAETRIHYVQGRAPTATTRTVDLPTSSPRPTGPDGSEQTKANVIEVALSSDAVAKITHGLGETLFLALDPRDQLNAGRNHDVMAAMEIVGVFEVDKPLDPFWYDDPSVEKANLRSLGGDARAIDTTALLAPEAYEAALMVLNVESPPFRTTWRMFVATDRLVASRMDPLIVDLRKLDTTFLLVTSRTLDGTAMRSGLLPLVQTHAARWTSAVAILTVVAIGPAAAALAALGLVATIAARRRRPALTLVRDRGGTVGQIVRAVFLEGVVLAVPALGLAVLVAALLLPAGNNRATIAAAAIVATLAVGLLIVTAPPGTTSATAQAGRDGDAPRGLRPRRLVLDIVVIAFAGFGAYLLRERGVRGTSSTGTLSAADPLIAAVPALAAIAVGLAAVRLVPLPLRLLGRVAAAGRGLVPLLALRRAVQGGTTTAVLIVLLAAASIGAFSSTALVHLDRAGEAASWHDVGAPYQVSDPSGSLPAALDPTKLDGVEGATVVAHTEVQVGLHKLQIQFISIDAAAYEAMVAGTPADPILPPEMLASDPGPVVPLLMSSSVVTRPDGVKIGDQFELVVNGLHYKAMAIAARDTFATMPTNALFAVASRQQLRVFHPEAQLIATTLFLDAPETSGPAIRAAVATVAPGATVEGRAEVAAAFRNSPVTAAIVVGIALAGIVAALYAALAVAAALALAGNARAVEVAHLRALGLSRQGALGLVIVEHGPVVAIALVAGIALGLGLFVLLKPGLGLDALVGSRLDVPLTADPRQLAVILGSVLVITIVGIGLAAWMQRRGTPVAALRRGFE